MLKETGYQEKIEMLTPWMDEIVESIKKDLKQDHLKADRQFCKKYFLGKNPAQVTTPEMAAAYRADILAGNVALGEFIATRWLLKNTDIYGYFEEALKKVTRDFELLSELPLELSQTLMQSSVKQYGAKKTYLFAVFNSVVFPQAVYVKLKELAQAQASEEGALQSAQHAEQSLIATQAKYEQQIAALTDKYEKKLSGLQRKYVTDTEALKKQIATLQKKLTPL